MSLPGLNLSTVCKKELKFLGISHLKTSCLSSSAASTPLLSSCTECHLHFVLPRWLQRPWHAAPSTWTAPLFLFSLPGFSICLENCYNTLLVAPCPQDRADDSHSASLQCVTPTAHFPLAPYFGEGAGRLACHRRAASLWSGSRLHPAQYVLHAHLQN